MLGPVRRTHFTVTTKITEYELIDNKISPTAYVVIHTLIAL